MLRQQLFIIIIIIIVLGQQNIELFKQIVHPQLF